MSALNDNRLSYLQISTCAGMSGVISRTFTAPLDVLKVITQIGVLQSDHGIRSLASKIKIKDGIQGFWRGNFTSCVKLIPHSVIQFTSFNHLKWTFSDDLGRLSAGKSIVAGTLAGINATLFTYPLDLIKTRFIVQPFERTRCAYNGIGHAFIRITQQEGIFGLYRGFSVTLAGSIPYAVATYTVFELLDLVWMKPRYRLQPIEIMIQGSLASSIALTISFPFDIIRKRMQAQGNFIQQPGGIDFSNGRECFKSILINHGKKGLWRGILPAILKVAPYNGIMFMSYELCKRFSLYHNGYSDNPFTEPRRVLDQNVDRDEMQDISDYDIELDIEVINDKDKDS